MQFIKKYLKFIIGIAALVFAVAIFFFAQRSESLEGGALKNWLSASSDQRAAAVRILTGSDEYTDAIVQCVDKIATLPESGEMAISAAASLCFSGMQVRGNI